MSSPFQEVYNEHYQINNETFKVVLLIGTGSKFDAGMMPNHFLEIQKLPDLTKYLFHKAEVGLPSRYEIVSYNNDQAITWTDDVQRQLLNRIKNQPIPARFFINPALSNGFF